MFSGHGEGSWIDTALILGELGNLASLNISGVVLTNKGFEVPLKPSLNLITVTAVYQTKFRQDRRIRKTQVQYQSERLTPRFETGIELNIEIVIG